MLLTIDVGNTNAVFGLYDGLELVDHWRASSDHRRTADEWRATISQFLSWRDFDLNNVDALILASVVPPVTVALRRMCERLHIAIEVVSWETNAGLEIRLDNPREIGADRIANAVAAWDAVGGATVVVDMGTATTLDVIGGDGAYLGGVILPGMEISLDALFSRAAALKRVDLQPPAHVIGTSTVGAVQSGATYGYAAQVDGLCERVEAEIGPVTVLATGGLAGIISPLSTRITKYDPWLTLRGLALIHQRLSSATA